MANKKLEELKSAPHMSYSALNTYLNICPLQFYFRYVEHAPVERMSSCLPFGRAFHAALSEQALKAKDGATLEYKDLTGIFEDFFKAEVAAVGELLVYKQKETYDSLLTTGFDMLREVLNSWHDYYTIKDVACGFSIDMPGLSKPIIGEFDLLVEEGHDPCIVDWKTSAQKWASGKAEKDLQATLYSYAFKKMYGVFPLFRFDVVTKTKSPSVESHYTSRNDNDFARLEYVAGKVEDAVSKGVFLPCETSFACGDCAYADRCRNWHKS